jgi:hypothetical protein
VGVIERVAARKPVLARGHRETRHDVHPLDLPWDGVHTCDHDIW